MIYKRYQYWSREGKVVWTNWFPFTGKTRERIQNKSKKVLLNQYKEFKSNPNESKD